MSTPREIKVAYRAKDRILMTMGDREHFFQHRNEAAAAQIGVDLLRHGIITVSRKTVGDFMMPGDTDTEVTLSIFTDRDLLFAEVESLRAQKSELLARCALLEAAATKMLRLSLEAESAKAELGELLDG